MGSTGSKEVGASSSSGGRGARARGSGVFHSSCLGGSSGTTSDDDSALDDGNKDGGSSTEMIMDAPRAINDTRKSHNSAKLSLCQRSCVSPNLSNMDLDEWSRENIESGAGSSSTQTPRTRSTNQTSRTCSRFSFIPNGLNFRLRRATSMGSLQSCSFYSTSNSVSNPDGNFAADVGFSTVNDFLPSSRVRDSSSVLQLEHPSEDSNIISSQGSARNDMSSTFRSSAERYLQRSHSETEDSVARHSDGIVAREPLEASVQFSRVMSVGRLRDRVHRRTPLPERIFGNLQEDRDNRDVGQGNRTLFRDPASRVDFSDGDIDMPQSSSNYHNSTTSSNRNGTRDVALHTEYVSETRNQGLLEHRTTFLERRRRIRSQVRALQRLGSRFENLSGHDQSCILLGQHRSGHCTCRASGRAPNPDEDMSTRASISRIVMLAEALFEVLDEIHQQSVALTSRPSMSSIGSIPAPKEVVDCMPLKIYTKPQKHQIEEAAQCYICLVEYEEGDCMRILPCHHDFHQTCIDKWLKEIHRVCPLCRRNVCRPDR